MTPALAEVQADRWQLLPGDCAQLLRALGDNSVDALVTDPPAGIGFMGKAWDHHKGGREAWIEWLAGILRECIRVLKPGAHALVWALPRTSHWTATALEVAGFEVRDRIAHLFGTGFPKSLNIGGGWGTALKPACEDWWLCRKPLQGTVAANVGTWGTGGLNIDGCRIDGAPRTTHARGNVKGRGVSIGPVGLRDGFESGRASGRWPANVCLDEEAAAVLDVMTESAIHGAGAATDGAHIAVAEHYAASSYENGAKRKPFRLGDSGGASRFFYTAKAPRDERDAGLEFLPPSTAGEATDRKDGSAGLQSPRAGAGRTGGARNTHPTVKSLSLMRWLCRLVTPPRGLVLDPFAGSGSTGVACLQEGFRFLGIEQDSAYVRIATERLTAWAEVQERLTTIEARASGQLALFGGGK